MRTIYHRVYFSLLLFMFLPLLMLIGCKEASRKEIITDTNEIEMGGETVEATITYAQDVKAIIDSHCAHCHVDGGAGLFDLTRYESAKMWGPAMVEATTSLRMPPWGAYEQDDCNPTRPWKEDLSLTDEQRSILAQWVADGSPEGDMDQVVHGTPLSTGALERVDFEGRAATAIDIPPGQDAFICVVIDPELTEETWLKGVEFIPDNEALVHHVVLFTDPTRASLDLINEQGVYPCFGSAQVPGSVAAAWAPGIQPNVLPKDHAMRIEAGTLFVMQMHYSPQGGATELSDQTTLRFQYADEPPQYEAYLQLMGNMDFTIHPALGLQPTNEEQAINTSPEFVIPAGAQNHREKLRWTYTGNLPLGGPEGLKELKLISISPHMHYAGVDMKVYLDRPDPNQGACEAGSLTGFFSCANQRNCLENEDVLTCIKTECNTEWEALSLSCWGCAHRVFTNSGDQANALAQITACERPEPDRMSLVAHEPTHECLISTPHYAFEWQRAYRYDTALKDLPTFMPGDVLTIDCGYDNHMDNPNMRAALSRAGLNEPEPVVLGDETLDEMCLVGLLFSFERRDER